ESKKDISFSKQPQITLTYKEGSRFNQLYYYDWYNLKFEKIDAVRDTIKHTLQFDFPAGKQVLQFAIFSEPELVGTASWYVHPKYKTDLIAASVDFAQDTKIKVINLDNNKEVIVTVKDYGPDKSVFPDRVVDLSKEAFKKIASTSQGVIRVKVIPVE
ncbi:MAG: septal ring lytic transglycosylase RlpA family protein, partial [Patescibacteria group bacterium]